MRGSLPATALCGTSLRVAALDAVVAGLGISAAQAMRVARRLRRRLLVSPLCPPLIEIMPRAGVRYMITSDADEE